MKFAKELERDLVPEWRIKYLNYKAGKKYVKAVARAINRANGTPLIGRRGDIPPRFFSAGSPFAAQAADGNGSSSDDGEGEEVDPLRESPAPIAGAHQSAPARPTQGLARAATTEHGERASLARSPGRAAQYGSFPSAPALHNTPPAHGSPLAKADSATDFELPAPAIRVPSHTHDAAAGPTPHPHFNGSPALSRLAMQRSASMAPTPGAMLQSRAPWLTDESPRQRLVRLLSVGTPPTKKQPTGGIDMQNLDEVRDRERDFFRFLDRELEKVETFYRQKEDQAGERLDALREQLHEMRNRRTSELVERKRLKERGHVERHDAKEDGESIGNNGTTSWIDPLKAKILKVGPNSKALQKMAWTPVLAGSSRDGRRDYTRRPTDPDVPYRTAKRKLKLAMQEFYRGLELLKSYALLNRTAFRKLNKKYDKAVNARPPLRYLNEKVNKAWFVNSDVLDGHIKAVEDMYARYFERGNHKIAAGKLRSLAGGRPGDESASAFRNGLLVGVGGVFALQALVYGSKLLFSDDPTTSLQTAYLLQIYGGYFLMLYLLALFCLDCHIWTMNKINYPFIFEFDPRHHLDWRQLAEFPSFFLLVFGVVMWLNFTGVGDPKLFLWWPVVLVGLTLVIICLPAPIMGHKSRRWFLYSHWRLLLAGLYPVEFRDFFLGDIYCSLTYATANIELFFCLYATAWGNPVQCNSNHSRLLGFLTTLPGIWRAFQCIRRYKDTQNVFPHLVNCGKYLMTIMSYVALSMYRMQRSDTNLALFIVFSTINSIYCSIWDLFMDFSLLQPNSRHYLLRDVTALKRKWWYYAILLIDPILRWAWVFYAIFTYDAQHSTIVSFLVSFAEVTRRGAWTLFRVENEHCANVAQYKASRDVPLPYRIEPLVERVSLEEEAATGSSPSTRSTAHSTGRSTGLHVPTGLSSRTPPTAAAAGSGHSPAVSAGEAPAEAEADAGGLRRRRTSDALGALSIRNLMAAAHKQDYEKRRRPAGSTNQSIVEEDEGAHSDDDDDASLAADEDDVDLRGAEILRRRGDQPDGDEDDGL